MEIWITKASNVAFSQHNHSLCTHVRTEIVAALLYPCPSLGILHGKCRYPLPLCKAPYPPG